MHADAHRGRHSRRFHHELNTAHLGHLRQQVTVKPNSPLPETATAGSRVILMPRQQAPEGADAIVVAEGGGRLEL